MTRKITLRLGLLLILLVLLYFQNKKTSNASLENLIEPRIFALQSIDTMKFSRDLAREKSKDLNFDAIIESQVKQIKDLGATHVGIATPYDPEFIPILRRWVSATRKHNLNVWFRGNLAGWEGWFNYPKINRAQHIQKIEEFVLANKDIFEDGDIFTPCPECENGGSGDPRNTKDVSGFRQFLIQEQKTASEALESLDKQVVVGFYSMNGDVGKLIMDKPTTASLGGVATIDHYVSSPERMDKDIVNLASSSGGKVVLGEMGAPIPDINGPMDEQKQADFINNLLWVMYKNKVLGVNYWTLVGSSTELLNSDGTPRPASTVLQQFFKPAVISVNITDSLRRPITGANLVVSNGAYSVSYPAGSNIELPVPAQKITIKVTHPNYIEDSEDLSLSPGQETQVQFNLGPVEENILEKILKAAQDLL